VLLRADGRHEMLSAGRHDSGNMPASRYEPRRDQLAAGDLLVLYTDGVTEGGRA